jgi:hypothetical protein
MVSCRSVATMDNRTTALPRCRHLYSTLAINWEKS